MFIHLPVNTESAFCGSKDSDVLHIKDRKCLFCFPIIWRKPDNNVTSGIPLPSYRYGIYWTSYFPLTFLFAPLSRREDIFDNGVTFDFMLKLNRRPLAQNLSLPWAQSIFVLNRYADSVSILNDHVWLPVFLILRLKIPVTYWGRLPQI